MVSVVTLTFANVVIVRILPSAVMLLVNQPKAAAPVRLTAGAALNPPTLLLLQPPTLLLLQLLIRRRQPVRQGETLGEVRVHPAKEHLAKVTFASRAGALVLPKGSSSWEAVGRTRIWRKSEDGRATSMTTTRISTVAGTPRGIRLGTCTTAPLRTWTLWRTLAVLLPPSPPIGRDAWTRAFQFPLVVIRGFSQPRVLLLLLRRLLPPLQLLLLGTVPTDIPFIVALSVDHVCERAVIVLVCVYRVFLLSPVVVNQKNQRRRQLNSLLQRQHPDRQPQPQLLLREQPQRQRPLLSHQRRRPFLPRSPQLPSQVVMSLLLLLIPPRGRALRLWI